MARIFFQDILKLTCIIPTGSIKKQVLRGIRFHPVSDILILLHTKKLLRKEPIFPRSMTFILIATLTTAHHILCKIWPTFASWYNVIDCQFRIRSTISTLVIPSFFYLLPPHSSCLSCICSVSIVQVLLG